MLTKNELLAEAINLPAVERAQLIEELISTLDVADRQRLDDLWSAECESRISAYERGKLKAVPLQTVFEKIERWKK